MVSWLASLDAKSPLQLIDFSWFELTDIRKHSETREKVGAVLAK